MSSQFGINTNYKEIKIQKMISIKVGAKIIKMWLSKIIIKEEDNDLKIIFCFWNGYQLEYIKR